MKPVAKIIGCDEHGPMIEWNTHWVDLIGKSLCASEDLETLQRERDEAVRALTGLADEFVKVYPIYYYAEPWAHDKNAALTYARQVISTLTKPADRETS